MKGEIDEVRNLPIYPISILLSLATYTKNIHPGTEPLGIYHNIDIEIIKK
jgi:hypothetical protein